MDNSVTVNSLSVKELQDLVATGDHAVAGIHPWWLEELGKEEIGHLKDQVLELLKMGRLWGIGETGLDRTMPELMEEQKELFTWHMELAEKLGLPLVIHNVRAGADFLEILKSRQPNSPWIFHDFRGNEQLVKDLLRLHSGCFFSFGISLDNSPQVRELFPLVPLENIFLETDDQKHLDIHDIYLRAQARLDVDLEFLKSQLWLNFKKISRQGH